MDTSKLKSFAPAVRKKLHEAIGRKLDFVLAAQTPDLRTTYEKQVTSLREKSRINRKALIEEAAYTWFNRLTALRYLDAQGWHPFNAKILMPAAPGEAQPEILKMVNAGSMPEDLKSPANHRRIMDLLNRNIPSQNPEQEAYRMLVLGACRFYHATLPTIFAKVDDETELLLPDDLLGDLSIAAGFRTEIQDADCDDVEVIGWLYQFYISEEKDTVMARKSAVPTEDIPAVTQLFTPHWIVRYLVENSLGRLWLLNRPTSGLKAHMPYYIEGDAETDFLKIAKPEEIKLVDPAVGSGHMLTYAFDLLYLIYEEEGYPASDIPGLILKHNLHGIEICPRAAQLAELALAFKARKKARRFFQPGTFVRPQITELQEIRFNGDELREYIKELKLGALFDQGVIKLLHQFKDAKNFGSLIQPCLDERSIADVRLAIEAKDLGGQLFLRETHLKVQRVLEQAEVLAKRYHVLVANPPYMGKSQINPSIKKLAADYYSAGKADIYGMFMLRAHTLCNENAYLGMITMQGWMFSSSFSELRNFLSAKVTLIAMAHLGPRAFDSISGEVVQTTCFVIRNKKLDAHDSTFLRLVEGRSESDKDGMCRNYLSNKAGKLAYSINTSHFKRIPGAPYAYWFGEAALANFDALPPLSESTDARSGMATGDNERFLRRWYEVGRMKIGFQHQSSKDAAAAMAKWIPYNKGGGFRKWYGNNEFVVLWENDGLIIKQTKTQNLAEGKITANNSKCWNQDRYFQECITWSAIGSGSISLRYSEPGFIFDTKGQCLFTTDLTRLRLCHLLLNSSAAQFYLSVLAPTLDFNSGSVSKIPDCYSRLRNIPELLTLQGRLVDLSKSDWNYQEVSWEFESHTLLQPGLKGALLETSWINWGAYCTDAIRRMQDLETENHRLFIAAYGLDDDLKPEANENQISLARADSKKDMSAFLSYAVGCMMGRYSLEKPGIILADSGDTLEQYLAKVGKSREALQFQPDDDGILPVMDVEWFEDDIVSRLEAFLVATFGADKLTENIQFIEKSLGTEIRSYFLGGFYKDHLQTYKKRPIYWMAQSPKKAFCALIYLHRYTKDTLSLLLNSYLRPYIVKLNSRIEILAQTEVSAGTAREKTAARKELEKLRKYVRECQEWERDVLLPAAQSRIDLDLDDGVKVNYLKLGDVLTPIPGLATKDEE
jgi:hypothetical protein